MSKWLILIFSIVGLTACATVPDTLQGNFTEVTPGQARATDAVGARVRWGGSIAEVMPRKTETCFELVGYPLNDTARPIDGDTSSGRFIACGAGFYDPAIYAEGRDVTVTGTLTQSVSGKIGDYDYQYPRVAVDTLYLWPQPTPRYYAGRGYYDPFFSPFYGYPFYGYRSSFIGFHGFGRFH